MINRSTSRLHTHCRFSTVTPARDVPPRPPGVLSVPRSDSVIVGHISRPIKSHHAHSYNQAPSHALHVRKAVIRNLFNGVCSHPIATVSFRLHPARRRFQPPPSPVVVILTAGDPTNTVVHCWRSCVSGGWKPSLEQSAALRHLSFKS